MSKASDALFDKVEHYVLMGDGEDEFCFDQEISRLLGVVSMLSDKEAMELFCMASIYWNHKVKAGIDIVAKKYLKNNIVGDYIYDFFNQVKNIPFSKAFTEKLAKEASKLDSAKADFLDK